MSMELMKKAVASYMRKDVPDFRIGDTVEVSVRIVEGEKERVQIFTGVVIARRGSGISEMFTVRRIVNNEGVERVFPLHSPKVAGVNVLRGGKVRRAKLYFLRDRVGKKTRLKDLSVTVPGEKEAPEAEEEQADREQASPEEVESAEKAEE